MKREEREAGIVALRFGGPDSPANLLDRTTLARLDAEVRDLAVDPPRALVFATGNPEVFLAGADVRELAALTEPGEVRDLVDEGQAVLRRLASFPATTVAEVHGACLGGGLELVLSLDLRIASDSSVTRFGFPEIALGILPAWGGSTRAARLLGLPRALDLVLTGRRISARRALRAGLVDDVVRREALPFATRDLVQRPLPKRAPRRLSNNRLVAAIVASRAGKQVRRRTRGNYPAPARAIEVMSRGLALPVSQALALEKDAVTDLAETAPARNLTRLFLLRQAARGGQEERQRPRTATVIGAGTMGADIAWWLATHETRVMLSDLSDDLLLRALVRVRGQAKKAVRAEVLTALAARDALDRIRPVSAQVPLHGEDLVIEAVTEDLRVKRQVFAEVERRAGPTTILATNTSSLSLARISKALERPERLLGLHFFNPVRRMELIEVVRGEETDSGCLAEGLAFARGMGKVPVVVADRPGFLVNRVLFPYLLAALRLHLDGEPVREIDEAMLDFGMAMGPFRLLDEVGLDVASSAARKLASALEDELLVPDLLDRMVAAGKLGRKSGRGFYTYRGGRTDRSKRRGRGTLRQNEMGRRLAAAMVREARRCLEEEVAASEGEIDLALVLGAGFAPFRGGPLCYGHTVSEGQT